MRHQLLFLHPTDNDLRGRHRFYRHRKMSFPAVSLSSNPSRSPLAFHHQNLHFPASLNESKELISDLEIANRHREVLKVEFVEDKMIIYAIISN